MEERTERSGLKRKFSDLKTPLSHSKSPVVSDYRLVLEVCKMCRPTDLLKHMSVVSNCWRKALESNELWDHLSESKGFPFTETGSGKDYYKRMCLQRKLAVLDPNSISIFDAYTESWVKTDLHPETDLQNDTGFHSWVESSHFSYAFLSDGSVVRTGGTSGHSNYENQRSAFQVKNGGVKRLPDMKKARHKHASILFAEELYVFGGDYFSAEKSCEKLSFPSTGEVRWIPLPDMMYNHYGFTLCSDSKRIFICGGNFSNNHEIFSPKTGRFSPLKMSFPVPLCAVRLEADLLVFGGGYVRRNKVLRKEFHYHEMRNAKAFSIMNPIALGNFVYQVNGSAVVRLDLDSGDLRLFNMNRIYM